VGLVTVGFWIEYARLASVVGIRCTIDKGDNASPGLIIPALPSIRPDRGNVDSNRVERYILPNRCVSCSVERLIDSE
jgi:hypothetical protein